MHSSYNKNEHMPLSYNTEKCGLDIHQRIETHKCSTCDKCFRLKSDFKKHLCIHPTGEKPYKRSIPKSHLKGYLHLHPVKKLFVCSTCDKCFTQKITLKSHQRLHTGEKPYECSTCDKYFTWKGDLKRHLRIHTGEKPYKCSICDKCYTRQEDLKRHLSIHTGEKPYECSRCDKCYRTEKSVYMSHACPYW